MFEDQSTALAPADAETVGPAPGDDPAAARLARCARTGRRQAQRRDRRDARGQGRCVGRRRREPRSRVKAKDGDAAGAAAIANTVAATYLAAPPRRRPPALREGASGSRPGPRAPAHEPAGRRTRSPPCASGSASSASARSSGTDELQVAEAARPPERPESPRPLQNTVLAVFAALFLAVLAALGARLHGAARRRPAAVRRPDRPRAARVLPGRAPAPPRRRGGGGLPGARRRGAAELSESRRVVLVTGAHAGPERAAVVAGLGRALTGSGVPTLLVSADLRHAALHEELDVPPGPGRRRGARPARARSRRERQRR